MKILLASLCLSISGCSVYSAAKAPAPVDYQDLVIGASRDSVVRTLGHPSYSDIKSADKKVTTTDNFEFTDGYHAGYKSRILLYLAGDIFSAGLAEVIFWPMEEYWLQGSGKKAVVHYDDKNKLQKISVFSDKDQALLYQKP